MIFAEVRKGIFEIVDDWKYMMNNILHIQKPNNLTNWNEHTPPPILTNSPLEGVTVNIKIH